MWVDIKMCEYIEEYKIMSRWEYLSGVRCMCCIIIKMWIFEYIYLVVCNRFVNMFIYEREVRMISEGEFGKGYDLVSIE